MGLSRPTRPRRAAGPPDRTWPGRPRPTHDPVDAPRQPPGSPRRRAHARVRRGPARPRAGAPRCTLVERGFGPAGAVPIRVERVASGLEVPWGIAFLPGGDALVTERPGRVRILRGGVLDPNPVTTVKVSVAEGGEGGLLGIAVDPRFAANRRFYVYATVDEGGAEVNQVSRYALAADGRSATLEKVLLDGVAGARFHDGGRIRFGPDGTALRRHRRRAEAGAVPRCREPERQAPADRHRRRGPRRTTRSRGARCSCAACGTSRRSTGSTTRPSIARRPRPERRARPRRAATRSRWPAPAPTSAGRPRGAATSLAGVTSPVLAFVEAMPPGGGSVYRGDAIPAWRGSFLVGTLGSRHLHRVVVGPDGRVAAHEVYLPGDPPVGARARARRGAGPGRRGLGHDEQLRRARDLPGGEGRDRPDRRGAVVGRRRRTRRLCGPQPGASPPRRVRQSPRDDRGPLRRVRRALLPRLRRAAHRRGRLAPRGAVGDPHAPPRRLLRRSRSRRRPASSSRRTGPPTTSSSPRRPATRARRARS